MYAKHAQAMCTQQQQQHGLPQQIHGLVTHDGGRQNAVVHQRLKHYGRHSHADAANDNRCKAYKALGDHIIRIQSGAQQHKSKRQ